MSEHYTDNHLVTRGSSVDLIERCAAYVRQSGDFQGVLDYADEDETGKFQDLLAQLEVEALRIIKRECGS